MSTFAAVQANQTDWCIQRSDGYYLQRNGSNDCWGTAYAMRYFTQQEAANIAWAINNRWVDSPPLYWTYSHVEPYSGAYCPFASAQLQSNRFLVRRTSDGATMWQLGYGSPYGCTPIVFDGDKINDVVWALASAEAPGV
jgi:hypothetical protein